MTLSDLDPPKAYTIAGEGSGGVAGFAKGSAKVDLDEDGGRDRSALRGPGACRRQAGADRLAPDRRDLAQDGDDFFERFVAAMSPPDAARRDPGSDAGPMAVRAIVARVAAHRPAAPGLGDARAETGAVSGRLPPVVWVTGLTAIVALMLYYFTRHGGMR